MQLRNLINRKNVPKDPKNQVHASEDFLKVMCIAHVIAAAMAVLEVDSLEASKTCKFIPENAQSLSIGEKQELLMAVSDKVVSRFVNIHVVDLEEDSEDGDNPEPAIATTDTIDGVHDYACEVLSLSLLYAEFDDAIKEGDAYRVLRCWKFFLLLFKASKRKNYAIEAFNLLVQFWIILPPRLAQQLAWSRFINTRGAIGCNIPCDLHMEHLNRSCKEAIVGLGANVTPKAIQRVGRCIGPLTAVCRQFDESSGIPPTAGAHSCASLEKDLNTVVGELMKSNVFAEQPGRNHDAFKTFKGSLIDKISGESLVSWMDKQMKKFK